MTLAEKNVHLTVVVSGEVWQRLGYGRVALDRLAGASAFSP